MGKVRLNKARSLRRLEPSVVTCDEIDTARDWRRCRSLWTCCNKLSDEVRASAEIDFGEIDFGETPMVGSGTRGVDGRRFLRGIGDVGAGFVLLSAVLCYVPAVVDLGCAGHQNTEHHPMLPQPSHTARTFCG